MAKQLASCRVRIDFPNGATHNIGLFYSPITKQMVMKIGQSSEIVTPSGLGQRLGKWIGAECGRLAYKQARGGAA